MLLLLTAACSPAMIRPAHSLGKLEASGNIGALVDPNSPYNPVDCLTPPDGAPCKPPTQSPVDVEYRIGLGAGYEVGLRGLFPPRALALKYAMLDERRHRTPVSIAVQAEGGVGLVDAPTLQLAPVARFDVLSSGTARLSPHVQLRPAASAGWWIEPRGTVAFNQGPGWTAGFFLPVRIPGDLGLAPYVGASGWLPLGGVPEVYARFGVEIESWLIGPERGIRASP